MCPTRLKVSWTKERVGIGENELEKLDWGEKRPICAQHAKRTINDDDDDDDERYT